MPNETLAVFDTTEGTFKIKLFAEQAPKTVENFVAPRGEAQDTDATLWI